MWFGFTRDNMTGKFLREEAFKRHHVAVWPVVLGPVPRGYPNHSRVYHERSIGYREFAGNRIIDKTIILCVIMGSHRKTGGNRTMTTPDAQTTKFQSKEQYLSVLETAVTQIRSELPSVEINSDDNQGLRRKSGSPSR